MARVFTSDASASVVEIPQLEQHLNAHPESPLFVRLADLYLRDGRPTDALKVLLEGLRRFPSYPTALYVLAKSQVMLRRYIDARSTLEALLRKQPGCNSAIELLERMQDLELKYPPIASVSTGMPGSSAVSRTEEENDHWSHRDDLLPGFDIIVDRETRNTGQESAEAEPERVDQLTQNETDQSPEAGTHIDVDESVVYEHADSETLELLAMRLEGARIPPLPEEEIAVIHDDSESHSIEHVDLSARPVTETLVAIYVQQGKIKEAVEGYRLMAGRSPDRAEYFNMKADELERNWNDDHVS